MLEDLRPQVQPDVRVSEGPGALGELVTCSADISIGGGQFLGVNAVRWAILSAAGIDGSLQGGHPALKSPVTISETP
jgi:GTP-binding protein